MSEVATVARPEQQTTAKSSVAKPVEKANWPTILESAIVRARSNFWDERNAAAEVAAAAMTAS
jgi:hypothetical protein